MADKLRKQTELDKTIQEVIEGHLKEVKAIMLAAEIEELILKDGQTFKRKPSGE